MATPEQAATAAVLLAQYDGARQRTRLTLTQTIRRLWWQFLGTPVGAAEVRRIAAAAAGGARPDRVSIDRLYDDTEVASLARSMARASRASQLQAGAMSGQFQRQLLVALGEPRSAFRLDLPEAPRWVDPEAVWQRPAVEFRYQRSLEVPEAEALELALARAEVIAEDDAALAEREGARQALQAADVGGYRRVVRPELSVSGSCGLCIAASDRLYHVAELLPVHARCKCAVMPVIGDVDPGSRLNRDDLDALYEAAGSTKAVDLKRVRVTVHQHGELGPVLRRAGDHFRDPDEVERAMRSAA